MLYYNTLRSEVYQEFWKIIIINKQCNYVRNKIYSFQNFTFDSMVYIHISPRILKCKTNKVFCIIVFGYAHSPYNVKLIYYMRQNQSVFENELFFQNTKLWTNNVQDTVCKFRFCHKGNGKIFCIVLRINYNTTIVLDFLTKI
jgi:hypothetical protein